ARPARRLAGDPAQPARRQAALLLAAGTGGETAAAPRLSTAMPAPQRRHPDPPQRHGRADPRPLYRPVARRRGGADSRRTGGQRAVRAALPAERGAVAAAAARPAGQAGAAVAPAAARPRPVAGVPAAPRLSHRRRDVPRMPARSSGRAALAAIVER